MAHKTKDEIVRTDIKYSMLQRIIIRADFTSMLDLDATVSDINRQGWFKNKFSNYEQLLLKPVNEDKPRKDNTEEIKEQYIKRFSDCNIAPEKGVILDIANNFMTIDIRCDEHYTTIDDYLSLAVDIISHIISVDSYVRLERIAIRKTDGMETIGGEKADEVFEYFSQGVTKDDEEFSYRTYTDSFTHKENNVKTHFNRTVRVIKGEKPKFIFILDIDAFLDRELLENRRPGRDELWDVFYKRINDTTFELFKRGVKEEFLNSILINQND